jgi:hypothetical protein
VQGFGSDVYQALDHPPECALLIRNWSGNSGFDLVEDAVQEGD